jgi:hypothetical protein
MPVLTISIPSSSKTASNAPIYLLSWSLIRHVTVAPASWRSMTRFLAAWVTQWGEAIVLCELLARVLDPAEYPYHVHVVEQLWADQPREVWESAQRLRARGLSRERVLELLAGALRPHVRELPVGMGGVGFDLKEYLDSLAAL